MKFIFFSGFLWMMAIFHLWDHRRYEQDIRRYMDGVRDGDWRLIATGAQDTVMRAFKISGRSDVIRYAGPVVFVFIWLVVFRYWAPAIIYMMVIGTKWFLVQTHIDADQRRYTAALFGRRLFSATLD